MTAAPRDGYDDLEKRKREAWAVMKRVLEQMSENDRLNTLLAKG